MCRPANNFSLGWLLSGMFAAAALGGDLPVTVRTVDREELNGSLVRFSLQEGLILHSHELAEPIAVPALDVVRIVRQRQADAPEEADQDSTCIELTDGDRLFGRITSGGEEHVVLDTRLHAGISIPLSNVRTCLLPAALTPQWRKAVARFTTASRSAIEDSVLLTNGDAVTGYVVSVGPDKVVFERDGREMQIKFDVVLAVALAGEPQAELPHRRAQIQLIDGSTLTLSRIDWSPNTLQITYFDGTLDNLAPALIRQVEVQGGRWEWLSDLAPLDYEHSPALALEWPLRVDHNAAGGPLVIDGTRFSHGLGVHSRSRLRYALAGRYQQFNCFAGIDDSASSIADVRATVSVDGQIRWEQNHLRAGMDAHIIRLDVAEANVLELFVDYGDNSDIQDRFNWAGAILVHE